MSATARTPDAEVHYIREVILRHLGTRVGKTFRQIKNAVENDYGSLSSGDRASADRRLYRYLEFLLKAGCIRREHDDMAQWDREDVIAQTEKFFYFFVHDRIPPPCRTFCKTCGLIGARSTSHENGHRSFMKNNREISYISITSEGRRASAQIPGSRPPAETSSPPDRPR